MGASAHHPIEVPVLLGIVATPLHGIFSIAARPKGSVLRCWTEAISTAEKEKDGSSTGGDTMNDEGTDSTGDAKKGGQNGDAKADSKDDDS